jgi:hypothetical protein
MITYYFYTTMPLLSYVAKAFFIGLLTMLMFYNIAVFITTCCGTIKETVTYSLVTNLAIPGIIFTTGLIIYNDLSSVDIDIEILDKLIISSPFGGVLFILALEEYHFPFFSWLLRFLLITVMFLAVSFLLYKKRKAEDVTKPFVFQFFYYVLLCSAVFTVSGLISQLESDIPAAAPIITGSVIFIGLDLIKNKGIKSIRQAFVSMVCLIATMAGLFSLINASDKTNGFHAEERIPKASQISSVRINGSWLNHSFYDYFDFTDPALFDDITAIHADCIEGLTRKFDYGKQIDVNIQYTLKNGDIMSRDYFGIPVNENTINTLNSLFIRSSEAKQQLIKHFRRNIWKNYEEYSKNDMWRQADPYVKILYIIDERSKDNPVYKGLLYNEHNTDNIERIITEICEAYVKDIMALNENTDIESAPYRIQYRYKVMSDFTNTIEAIENNIDYFTER